MATLITADNHFDHRQIIKYCTRPFANVTEMNEALVKNWNKVVTPQDTIHVVGDFAHGGTMEAALSIIKRLNGTKHLIVGNHDDLAVGMNDIRPGTWKTIKDISTVYIMNQPVILCHYALRTWHHSYRGVIHCYGHSHGTLPSYGKSFDVGVDCHNYMPWTSKEIIDMANSLPNIHTIPKKDRWDKEDKQ